MIQSCFLNHLFVILFRCFSESSLYASKYDYDSVLHGTATLFLRNFGLVNMNHSNAELSISTLEMDLRS